jgi:hypothetical protein
MERIRISLIVVIKATGNFGRLDNHVVFPDERRECLQKFTEILAYFPFGSAVSWYLIFLNISKFRKLTFVNFSCFI